MKNKHRVLLVEDDDDNREMLVLLLTRKGFEVTPARNGTEALELLSKMEPDTALVDIGLPDIDGYEVGRQARRIHGDKILLLALTGYGHADAKQRTRDVGFDEHLTKPVDLKRLEKIIAAGKSPAAPAGDGSRPRPSS